MSWSSPWAFALLGLLPLVLLFRLGKVRAPGIRFPSVRSAKAAGKSWRQRLVQLPLLFRLAALGLLMVALARPQEGLEKITESTHGVAIEMVVDRSGSMDFEMSFADNQMNRLDAAKSVFRDFVRGNDAGLAGRADDIIGLVVFARYADTLCPLTLHHEALIEFLDTTHVVTQQNEDGTAVGDAIALAAARLQEAEKNLGDGKDKSYTIKSKIIILLTDGKNNAGKREPMVAAQMAADWGVKIYAIGVGGDEAIATVDTPLGPQKVKVPSSLDEKTLTEIAKITGGQYWRAETSEELKQVYAEIDGLEKTEIQASTFLDFAELFGPWAWGALGCLLVEILLASTWLRRLP